MEYVKFIETISGAFNIDYSFIPERYPWSYRAKAPEHENDRVRFNYLYYKDRTPNNDIQVDVQLMNWPHCKQYATFYSVTTGRYFVLTDQNDGTWDLQENLEDCKTMVIRRDAKRLRSALIWIKKALQIPPKRQKTHVKR